MKKNIYIVIIVFFSFFVGFSQSSDFKSFVLDKQNSKPISEAIIEVKDLGINVESDLKGQFTIKTDTTSGLFVGLVSHKNYITKGFLIEFIEGKPIKVENIKLELTYKEGFKRKRRNQKRDIQLAKLRKKKLKELRRKEKKLSKERKELLEQEIYAELDIEKTKPTLQNNSSNEINNQSTLFSDLQYKYAKLFNVSVENLTNVELYSYIDQWYNETFEDDSDGLLFLEGLYINGYELSIETSIMDLYNSELTNKFTSKAYLREGDLLFFKEKNGSDSQITQVGVYLHNNKFVYKSNQSTQKIKIGDLTDDYWLTNFVSAGRRIFNK
ncbi:NlpC/P60 family protein [Lacinutrix salivirga]